MSFDYFCAMKRFLHILFLLAAFVSSAHSFDFSKDTRISLLTSDGSDRAIFTRWGHTAIRVNSPSNNVDVVFNYGVFAFDNGFVFKFVRGWTDYCLGAWYFEYSLDETIQKNSNYYEQVLNLTPSETEHLANALLNNYRPENRFYRYNFFYDNCSTRPRRMIENNVDGTVSYPASNNDSIHTYRDYIHQLLSTARWYEFGINMCLGSPTDVPLTDEQRLFLPMELKTVMDSAVIVGADGEKRRLVSETQVLLRHQNEDSKTGFFDVLTPNVLFWLMFLAFIPHVLFYYIKERDDRWAYVAYNSVLGLFGLLLFFLTFISVHPCVCPNYSLLWCSPLHMILASLVYVKSAQKTEYALFAVNIFLNILALGVYVTSLQFFDSAFAPIQLSSILLSAFWIIRRKKQFQGK